jgi:TDG/mug DNA glycosylase family protein
VLTDRIPPRPRILFVGINPSLRSAEVGHHFAGPGNPFWRLLGAAGLVPKTFTHVDDVRLPKLGLGLTNIVSRATRSAAEIAPDEYAKGRARLARKIARARPAVVAFVGITVYRWFVGSGAAGGSGPKPDRLGAAQVFVLPNPSGRNAAYPGFRDKLVWYRRLARLAAARSRPRHMVRSMARARRATLNDSWRSRAPRASDWGVRLRRRGVRHAASPSDRSVHDDPAG